MDYSQIKQIRSFAKLPPTQLQAAYKVVKEQRNTGLRIKHWKAIPELVAAVSEYNKLLAKMRKAAKKKRIALDAPAQPQPPGYEDFIRVGATLYSPHYNITAELVKKEYSAYVGTIYILRDKSGVERATSKEDLIRGYYNHGHNSQNPGQPSH